MLEQAQQGDMISVKLRLAWLDEAVADKFLEEMTKIVETGQRHFVLDMDEVEHIDSDGLNAIVALQKMVGRAGTVELTNVNGPVMKVLKLTRTYRTMSVHKAA